MHKFLDIFVYVYMHIDKNTQTGKKNCISLILSFVYQSSLCTLVNVF